RVGDEDAENWYRVLQRASFLVVKKMDAEGFWDTDNRGSRCKIVVGAGGGDKSD
ncbi:unnamed protein product, partial [Ilex paraguariensis]